MLPAARLDAILARHADIGAERRRHRGPRRSPGCRASSRISTAWSSASAPIAPRRANSPTSIRFSPSRRSTPRWRRWPAASGLQLQERLARLEHEVRLVLLPKDATDDRSVILEVRAGTGGDEAALFAGDLFRMYQRYADLQGWKRRDHLGQRRHRRRLQGNRRRDHGRGRVRPAEVRERAPTASSACRRPRHPGASTPRRRRWRCCR